MGSRSSLHENRLRFNYDVTWLVAQTFFRKVIPRRNTPYELDVRFMGTGNTCYSYVRSGLALPYIMAHSIVPLFVPNGKYRALIGRRVYPSFLIIILLMVFSVWQLKQFKRLYEHIKNDKYLVGRRLVNYNHRNESQNQN